MSFYSFPPKQQSRHCLAFEVACGGPGDMKVLARGNSIAGLFLTEGREHGAQLGLNPGLSPIKR